MIAQGPGRSTRALPRENGFRTSDRTVGEKGADMSGQTCNPPVAPRCPDWCVAPHGRYRGEEDWIHLGEPLRLTRDGIRAQLCLSVDPATGVHDGPYVLIGSTEYSPVAAAALGRALMGLAELVFETSFPEDPSRSTDPPVSGP